MTSYSVTSVLASPPQLDVSSGGCSSNALSIPPNSSTDSPTCTVVAKSTYVTEPATTGVEAAMLGSGSSPPMWRICVRNINGPLLYDAARIALKSGEPPLFGPCAVQEPKNPAQSSGAAPTSWLTRSNSHPALSINERSAPPLKATASGNVNV